jgi:glucokinase
MTAKSMILAGDVGGTGTDLALVDETLQFHERRSFVSRDYASLADIVAAFLDESPQTPTHACFGVAGPVRDGRATPTNLPWVVEARDLARLISVPEVLLLNDIEVIGHGIGALDQRGLVTLQHGASQTEGNAAVIAAGTGLGQAGMYWDGTHHWPFASEGGHASFAPRNDLEMQLLRFLSAEYEHVSWERVVSGPGLFNVYRFFRDSGRFDEPAWLVDLLQHDDAPAVVARCALEGSSTLCEQSLELFVTLFGAEAGNLALKVLARGGVYLAGGIAPKILDALTQPPFRDAFVAKGRMRALLEGVPVRVVVDDRVSLMGAARAALFARRSAPRHPLPVEGAPWRS